MNWLVAHQGAWDEILLLVVPIGLAVGAVRWATKRAENDTSETGSNDPDGTRRRDR